ncbi:hypothetical protein NIES2104_46840 [Leptolyngbya sp. NIES-2104]|nr:hypothetical protein NIES2104_46840 [Leptolyngbya sp. NIES-2104]
MTLIKGCARFCTTLLGLGDVLQSFETSQFSIVDRERRAIS